MNNKINTEKAKALISLLDDPDDFVYREVRTAVLNSGLGVIPELQNAFHASNEALKSERLAEILDQLKLEKLTSDIDCWRANEPQNLLEGMLHIARYAYPSLDTGAITSLIDEMVQSVKSKIVGKSPKAIAEVFNDVILEDFGFGGNHKDYSALNNSFINKVMETRVSNPIGLSVIYLLVARAVGVPLVGINSPGHFVLGYSAVNNYDKEALTDKITFFIDPFNSGQIIESKYFNVWLNVQAVSEEIIGTIIATDKAIIKRVFNNLIYALYTSGEESTAEKLLEVAESI